MKLLQTGVKNSLRNYKSMEIELDETDRIIGFKARKDNEKYAYYYDFQFIIGKPV